MKNFVVFDLDGTLIDTLIGLTEAVNLTLKEINKPYYYSKEEVKSFIGRGARRLFTLATKNSFTDAEFDLYLKNYEKCQYISEPFNGAIETLTYLKEKGYKLIIYSNKPNDILQKLIKNKLGMIEFDYIQGQDNNFPPKPDITLLNKIFKELNLKSENGIYVGDSIVDLETAKNAKLESVIFSFGYGNQEEIKNAKPDYYFDEFENLKEILWVNKKN